MGPDLLSHQRHVRYTVAVDATVVLDVAHRRKAWRIAFRSAWMCSPRVSVGSRGSRVRQRARLDPAAVAEMVGHDDGGYLIATVYTKLASVACSLAPSELSERQAAATSEAPLA
jgi:hypothetical protein